MDSCKFMFYKVKSIKCNSNSKSVMVKKKCSNAIKFSEISWSEPFVKLLIGLNSLKLKRIICQEFRVNANINHMIYAKETKNVSKSLSEC